MATKKKELAERAKQLRTEFETLYKKRRALSKAEKIRIEKFGPYKPQAGFHFKGKYESLFLYYRPNDKTYYTSPIRRENGRLIGCKASRKFIENEIKRLKADGYTKIT